MTGWRNLLVVGILVTIALDAHSAVDRTRMRRDIRIMEGVLGKLLSGENAFGAEPEVRGMYFDGYGVLLLVDRPRRVARLRDYRTIGSTRAVEVELADLRGRLVEFYTDYAEKLQLLPDPERVTVRIKGVRGSDPFYGAFRGVSDEATEEEANSVEENPEAEIDEDEVRVKHYGFDPARVRARIEEARKRVNEAIGMISPERGGAFPSLVATATKAEIDAGAEGLVKFAAHSVALPTDRSL